MVARMEPPVEASALPSLEPVLSLAVEQMESLLDSPARQESWRLVEQRAATRVGEPLAGVLPLKRLAAPGGRLPQEVASLAEEPLPAPAAPLAPPLICGEQACP